MHPLHCTRKPHASYYEDAGRQLLPLTFPLIMMLVLKYKSHNES